MGRTFTRNEIYDLVWSHPRTTLGKQLGVSDVWIGKQCVHARVPMPPLGYWAKHVHGKPTRRTPLPLRLPGHPRLVSIGESSAYAGDWRFREDLNEPILPPSFEEDIEDQVRAAVAAIGTVRACRDLSSPHESLSRVFAAEERRRSKFAVHGWSTDKPLFDGPTHQRQMRIFSSLSIAFGRIHVRAHVDDDDEWVQGRGTVHQLRLRLDFGDSALVLRFAEPSDIAKAKGERPPAATTLRVGADHEGLPGEEWADAKGARIEQQLSGIARALLLRAEKVMRSNAQQQYEWRLKRRQEHIEALEAQRVEAERKRLAALEARRKQIRNGIVALAADRRMAEDIRSLIGALKLHPDELGERSAVFEAWCAEAQDVANGLDPLERPLEEVLARFRLKDVPLG